MVFLKALSVLLGTVIGVGMFGLPFAAQKAGFFVVLIYLFLMALVVVATHLAYGDIVLGTKGSHRLPGYVGEYLGRGWKRASFVILMLGLLGALLAYLIVGGRFLSAILSPLLGGGEITYTLIFFSFGSWLVLRDIKSVSVIELVLLLVILSALFLKSSFLIDVGNFKGVQLRFMALPYGVVLFSLWGSSVIPEIKEMIMEGIGKKEEKKCGKYLKTIVFTGIVFAALIYLAFVFMVLGVSGKETSEEALLGLVPKMGGGILAMGFLFGVIACFTSFLTIALTLKKMLWYDFGVPKNISWALACFVPLLLFFMGLKKFIDVIGLTGALSIGAEGVILVLTYRAFLQKKFSKNINPAYYFLALVFLTGIFLEILYFASKFR